MKHPTTFFVVSCLLGADAFQQWSSTVRLNEGRCIGTCINRLAIPPSVSTIRAVLQRENDNHLISVLNRRTKQSRTELLFSVNPVAAGAVVCGLQASIADVVAQKLQNRQRQQKENTVKSKTATPTCLNWRRTFGFLVYGVLYQGLASEFIYNRLYPMFFGVKTDLVTVVQKVVFDLFFQSTIVTLPVAYWSKSVALGGIFRHAMMRYIDDVKNNGLLKKYWSLWGPVQGATFGVVPEHLRIPFIASISFFWVIILSCLSSRSKPSAPSVEEDDASTTAGSGLATSTGQG